MATLKKTEFVPERRHATLTPAKAVRLAREFQEMTQHQLAKASGVPQPAIAGIESGRIALGSDRAGPEGPPGSPHVAAVGRESTRCRVSREDRRCEWDLCRSRRTVQVRGIARRAREDSNL